MDSASRLYGKFRDSARGCIKGNERKRHKPSPKIIAPYSAFSLTHISQVHFFYLAELGDESFGPTSESSEVELFDEKDIPWDQIAFPTVTKTLKYYFEDKKKGDFPFREESLKLW